MRMCTCGTTITNFNEPYFFLPIQLVLMQLAAHPLFTLSQLFSLPWLSLELQCWCSKTNVNEIKVLIENSCSVQLLCRQLDNIMRKCDTSSSKCIETYADKWEWVSLLNCCSKAEINLFLKLRGALLKFLFQFCLLWQLLTQIYAVKRINVHVIPYSIKQANYSPEPNEDLATLILPNQHLIAKYAILHLCHQDNL